MNVLCIGVIYIMKQHNYTKNFEHKNRVLCKYMLICYNENTDLLTNIVCNWWKYGDQSVDMLVGGEFLETQILQIQVDEVLPTFTCFVDFYLPTAVLSCFAECWILFTQNILFLGTITTSRYTSESGRSSYPD